MSAPPTAPRPLVRAHPRGRQPRAHDLRRLRLRPLRQPEDRRRLGGALGRRILMCRRAIDPRARLLDPAGGLSRTQQIDQRRRRARGLGRGAGKDRDRGAAGDLRHPAHQPGPADLPRPPHRRRGRGGPGKPRSRALRLGRDPVGRDRLPVGALGAPPRARSASKAAISRHAATAPPDRPGAPRSGSSYALRPLQAPSQTRLRA